MAKQSRAFKNMFGSTGEKAVKRTRTCAFSLVFLVLLTFLFWNGEGVPATGSVRDIKSEGATLTRELSHPESLKSVDEVNAVIYHAALLRRISHRQTIRSLKLCLKLFTVANIVLLFFLAACCFGQRCHYGRIVLIRYIHNSDGKK